MHGGAKRSLIFADLEPSPEPRSEATGASEESRKPNPRARVYCHSEPALQDVLELLLTPGDQLRVGRLALWTPAIRRETSSYSR